MKVTTRKKPSNSSAYAAITNAPPNTLLVLPSDALVITGINVASTTSDTSADDGKRDRSGQIRSARRTTTIRALRTISGANAWKSTWGFSNTYKALDMPWTSWVTAGSNVEKRMFG